jgi:hypothetical protein
MCVLVSWLASKNSTWPKKDSIVSNRIIPRVVLASVALISCASAADLRPDQKAAVEKILATMDASTREMVRPSIEQSIMYLTPEQVTMFVSAATKGASGQDQQQAPVEEEPEREATPEDLAYNRAQYEPALRKHWQAKKAFDTFVDAELAAKCPKPGKYAVYREAERYDVMELSPTWQRAPDNQNAEASIVGGTYAPKDGRYDFDFSKVRMTFNKETVSNAIATACADWTKEAVAFKEKAQALMISGQSQAALDLEGSTSKKVSAMNSKLQAVLDAEGPAGKYNAEMMDALQNPKRAK